jgi:hypothetical protein
MSLWKRLQPQDFGSFKQVSLPEGPATVLSSNPDSDQFDETGVSKPKDLVNYMLSVQKQKFDSTILEQFSYTTLMYNAKRLMGLYPSGVLKRAVKKAADISNHPFSFKVVENICQSQQKD